MKKINRKEFELLQDEYIVNQGQVKTIIGTYIKQRNLAVGFAALVIAITGALNYQALKIAGAAKHVEKVVFKEDGTGGLTMVGVVNDALKADNKIYIDNQLEEYIVALYSIPSDQNARAANVTKVNLMTSADYFSAKLQKDMRSSYATSGSQLIEVNPTTIAEVTKNVWEINWEKMVNGAKVGDYKSLVAFTVTDTAATMQFMKFNPLGILVTNVETIERSN